MISAYGSGVLGRNLVRRFTCASDVFPAVSKLNDSFTRQSLDLYKSNKMDVDKELDKVCFSSSTWP
jgi:hypothetical protein